MQLHLVTDAPQPDFDAFWQAYPRKVAKAAARKAYAKALRLTDHATILEGLEAYKRGKPDYCDWCHASTWLNGERWEDEYEVDDVTAVLEEMFK